MSQQLRYTLLDVFTRTPLSGNQLAVFPEARNLLRARMRAIASELNLSETVFVTGGRDNRHDVVIMTPEAELPFAGHPTIGTAVALAMARRDATADASATVTLVEGVGDVPVTVTFQEASVGEATFEVPRAPEPVATEVSPDTAAQLLGLPTSAIAPAGPAGWSAGVPFLTIPLCRETDLAHAQLDTAIWREAVAATPTPHVYAYHVAGESPDRVNARMFAPAMGIAEDPATGAAAAALAGALADRSESAHGNQRHTVTIAQGDMIGRPSRLRLEWEVANDGTTRVRLGGASVIVGEGCFFLPPEATDRV